MIVAGHCKPEPAGSSRKQASARGGWFRLGNSAGAVDVLHHLLLQAAHALLAIHHVAALVHVLDVGQAERTTAILVACELLDGSLRIALRGELDDARTSGTSVELVLDLGTLNFADGGEKLDQVFVACAPGQVAHENGWAWLATSSRRVGERVWRLRSSRSRSWTAAAGSKATATISTAGRATVATSTVSSSTISATESAATSEASAIAAAATAKATTETSIATACWEASAESATAAEATCVAILADLENATLPVVAVELLDCVCSIVGVVKCHNASTLRATVRR